MKDEYDPANWTIMDAVWLRNSAGKWTRLGAIISVIDVVLGSVAVGCGSGYGVGASLS